MVLDQRGDHCAIGREGVDGGFFILPHQAAVARHIGAEDGGEFAFHPDRWRLLSHHASFLGDDYPAYSSLLSNVFRFRKTLLS